MHQTRPWYRLARKPAAPCPAVSARRNLVRNKLFPAINITGQATSMSVGLLLIAFDRKNILAFDLGLNTENILNITMLGNKPDAFMNKLSQTR